MPDDTNKPTTDQTSQQVEGNQQNISGDAEVTGPVVGGNVGQIGNRTITIIVNLLPTLSRGQWTAVGAALFVLLIGLTAYSTRNLWLPQPHCPADQTCLLIAAFGPVNEPKASEITTALEQEVRGILTAAGATDVAIVRSRPVSDPQAAQALAAEEGALLVIWGTVFAGEGRTRVYFSLVDRLGVGDSAQVRPYRAEPLGYDPLTERMECTNNCIDIAGEVTQRTHTMAWFALGLAHYAAGQPAEAQPSFLSALYCAGEEVDPTLLPVRPSCLPAAETAPGEVGLIRYYLGKSLVLQGDYRQGIANLTGAIQANPNDPAAWIAIGEAYTNWYADALPNPPQAGDAFSEAERVAGALPAASLGRQRAFSLGLIHEMQDAFGPAAREYTNAVAGFSADDPRAYVYLLALARALAQSGQPAEAEAALDRAATLLPGAPWAYLALALLHARERTVAEGFIEQARKVALNESYVAITHAELCVKWGDRACAADAYARAMELRPNSGWLHSRVGDFYLPTDPPVAGQSWEEAERHYRAAIDLRPADPWAHQRLGYVLLNLGQYAEAAAEYESAICLLPDDLPPGELACTLALAQERAGLPVTGDCPRE